MLLDRTHRTWALISAAIMAIATVSYVIYAESTPKGPSGGSLMGLIYGVVGSLMMIYAGLLGGRKQFPFWRLGSAQFWLRGHIWFGTLSFPLILFHAGFGLGGLLEQILMGFFFVVWLSGFFGLAMQHFMPKLLTSRIGRETFSVQIPYIRKRNRIIADKMVSADCGKVPLDGDPMQKDLTKLGTFAAGILAKEKVAKGKAAKDEVKAEKVEWINKVPAEDVGLFQDLAKHAKNEGWINKIDNFPDQIVAIYELPGAAAEDKVADAAEAPAKAGAGKPGAKAGGSPLDLLKDKKAASPLDQMKAKRAMSPLEQMKAKVAAAEGDDAAAKPKSPLEMARAKGGKKKAASPLDMARKAGPKGGAKPAGGAKPSPLEMARKSGAAGGGGATKSDDAPAEPAKKLSPLEMARKAGSKGGAKPAGGAKPSPLEMARKSGAAGGGGATKSDDAPVEPAKKLSPLEMARKAGGAGGGGAAKSEDAPAEPAAKLSPLEQIRQKAAGNGGAKKAALAPATPAAKPPVKKVAPAPKKPKKPEPVSEMVENVDAEISAVEKLLTEKYGFDNKLARSAAEKTREFLKADPAAEVSAIKSLFVEKYGYDESKASEIAEKVRPFIDGSAEQAAAEKAEAAQAAKAAATPPPAAKPEAGAAPAADAPLSKLDKIRQQVAFGSGGAKKAAAPAAAAASGKKLSPLEQLKAKAAGGKPAAAGKALSPIEQMKAKAGGAKPAAGGKPKSPLDMLKGKSAGGTAKPKSAKPAAKKAPAPVKKKAAVKRPVLRTKELRSFYLETVRPFLAGNGKKGRLADITEASRAFAQMRGTLPVELHDTLESLLAFCEEHRQFTEQVRIRAWLHYWLAIHIPFSIALFVLFAAHVVLALRVVPWDFPIRF
ncbi:MAG: hypothetical protein ACKVHE_01680 [Planctomycetales bacterium]